MAHVHHKVEAPAQVGCAVLTVSDTRNPQTDRSGQLMKQLLESAEHRIVHYGIVQDVVLQIKGELATLLEKRSCQAILLNGGTGISPRDITYETVSAMLDKRLDGFGEIFRYLSYQEIGSSAIMSRAVAGTARGRIIISVPGSTGAVRLAMERLILPELGHMVHTAAP